MCDTVKCIVLWFSFSTEDISDNSKWSLSSSVMVKVSTGRTGIIADCWEIQFRFKGRLSDVLNTEMIGICTVLSEKMLRSGHMGNLVFLGDC